MESTIIYGKNAVIEALEAGEREFNKILISNSARSDVKIERIKELAQKNGIVFQFVAPQKLNQLEPEGRHQGVIAQISPVKYTDLDDFIEKTGGNVVKVFSSIERSFFERKKLNDELKSVTALSNFVFKILVAIPFIIFIMIYVLNPEFFAPFITTTIGNVLLGIIILIYVVYVVVVKRVIKIRE